MGRAASRTRLLNSRPPPSRGGLAMKWLIAASTLALTACAPTLYVTYRTDPPGAMIYEGAKALGYAPLTAPYNVGDGFEHSKCLMLNPISARWVSGAETKPTPIK